MTTDTINNDLLIKLYESKKETAMGIIIAENGVFMECGRRFKMKFFIETPDFINNRTVPIVEVEQVTIRNIRLDKSIQKHGCFTSFILYLLQKGLAVRLESVQPEWLKKRCRESPHWILQTQREYENFNPVYVRFPGNNLF